MTDCLLIDDVEAALGRMTALGKSVVGPSAFAIRRVVYEFAARRRWMVVPYAAYIKWGRELLARVGGAWAVIDPLFPVQEIRGAAHARFVRITRSADLRHHDVGGIPDEWRVDGQSPTGILDDAAATGSTLRSATLLLHGSEADARRIHFAVCASTRHAHDSLAQLFRSAIWHALMTGNWRISHLRDGCPWLPFTGRPMASAPIACADGSQIEVRAPVTAATNNLWQVLWLDGGVHRTILESRISVVERLSAELGRRSILADLALLGAHVPAIVDGFQPLDAALPLAALCRSS